MIELYKHNLVAYNKVKKMLENERKTCIVHATGTGKSFIALKLIEDQILKDPNSKIVYFMPLNGIASQISEHLESMGLKEEYLRNIKFINYSNAITMLKSGELDKIESDLFITDEFHRIGAPEWSKALEKMFDNNQNAKIFGMSATPVRGLGTSFEENIAETFFDGNIASEYDLADAIIDGVLPEPEYHIASIYLIDEVDKLETRINSDTLNDEESKLQKETLAKIKEQIKIMETETEIFENNLKKNGKYIYFCPPGSNIEELQAAFLDNLTDEQKNNIEFYKVHSSEQSANDNIKSAHNFYHNILSSNLGINASDKLRVMFSVNMYNEGIHVPDIDGVIMGRETTSNSVYYQQLGRCLAVKKKNDNEKEITKPFRPLVVDLMGNVYNIYKLFKKVNKLEEKLIETDLHNNFELKQQGYTNNDENKNILFNFGLSDEIIDIMNKLENIKELRTCKNDLDVVMRRILSELKNGDIKSRNKETGKLNPTYMLLLKRKEDIIKAKDNGNPLAIELFNKSFYLNPEIQLEQEMKTILNELEDGVIFAISRETGKYNQTYDMLKNRKEAIIAAKNSGNLLATELFNKSIYLNPEVALYYKNEKLQQDMNKILEDLKGGIISPISEKTGKTNPTYSLLLNRKEDIIKAKEEGNSLAIELFNNCLYFNPKTKEQKLEEEMLRILNELNDGNINQYIEKTGKINPTYALLRNRKEAIITAKENGNQLANELFNKSLYLNPKIQLQEDMVRILNELSDGIIKLKIKETGKKNPTYALLQNRKKDILKAKEDGNPLAIELFNKSLFLNPQIRLHEDMEKILNELNDGIIERKIMETGKINPTYTLLQKIKNDTIIMASKAYDKNTNDLSTIEKMAIQLVSQSKYIQNNIIFNKAKEEYDCVVDFSKLNEIINNMERGYVNGSSLY